MGKDKIKRFEENKTFHNMFHATFEDLQASKGFRLKGKWHKEFFKNDNPIVLELGCGKGEYSVGLARKYRNKNFIGVDIKGARMWRGCKTSIEEGLDNVAFIRTQIEQLEQFFAENEVSEIWITFPDPQLKKAHKRLTSMRFLNRYKNLLRENGVIHLKTDSYELYEYTLEEVIKPNNMKIRFHSSDVYNSDCKDEAIEFKTFYESMYLQIGKPITYIEFEI